MTALTTHPSHSTTAPTTSPRCAARWAAEGYLAIFVLAIFANFLALDPVLHFGDADATAAALRAAQTPFRLGVAAFLAIVVLDVLVAWALYVLFRPVHRDLSLLGAWLRLGYTVALGAALGLLYAALWLADAPGTIAGASEEGVLLALATFDFTWVAALAVFGPHLIVTAVLLVKARGPRWVAGLLVAAGTAYVVDALAHIMLPDYENWSEVFLAMVAIPSILGEMSLLVWLGLIALGRRAAPGAQRAI